MGNKRGFTALLTAAVIVLSACGGKLEQPQYTTRSETNAAAETSPTEETATTAETAQSEEETDMDTDWLAKLTELVPPPENPKCTGTEEMRSVAEKRLGARLPDDYIELINTYGDGCFGYVFNVYNPFSDNKYYNLLTNDEQYFYEEFKSFCIEDGTYNADGIPVQVFNRRDSSGKSPLYGGWYDNEGHPFDYYPAENGLLACCQCEGQYTVYWKTGGDRWTIVAYGRYGEYSEFDMTLTEFLYKEITREINFGDMYNYLTEKGKVFIPFEETKEDCRIKEEDYKYNG